MPRVDYLLYETAVGYAIFEVTHQSNSVALKLKEVQDAVTDISKFGRVVKLANFAPFRGAQEALDNINEVSEGVLPEYLKNQLEITVPKTSGNKSKVVLGVQEKLIGGAIKAAFPGLDCETADTSEVVADLLRGIRLHAGKMLKDLNDADIDRAQLGLGHAYSRGKVKFSVQKNDNHVIQASGTLDGQDKGTNQFFMRVREWYGWHFPELIKIESDNLTYVKLVLLIGNKNNLTDDMLHDIAPLVGEDGAKAQAIIDAAKVSMGQDISEADLDIIKSFAKMVIQQAEDRRHISNYLDKKMSVVAPNLQTLIGTPVAARLITHAGSLTNLAKYPASTVQILGAEKALFRALKTKGNTPKYGIIYHSSFIGKSGPKIKGRISRYLANKCSIASRIDNFSEQPTTKFGEAMRDQVEDRIEFYTSGKKPAKNVDVMAAAARSVLADIEDEEMDDVQEAPKSEKKDKKKDKKKRKSEVVEDVEMEDAVSAETPVKVQKKEKKDKKDKKEKKNKKRKDSPEPETSVEKPKKKKKSKRSE